MRQVYPQPLKLPTIAPVFIRIYGQLIGPMNQPIPNVKISMRNLTTGWDVIQRQWSTANADAGGNYDFSVNPGHYAVFLEVEGKDNRIDNITVYSDSAAGSLQSFMLTPTGDDLTPLMVQECIASFEGSTAAELRARQWAENPIDVPVIDMQTGYGPEYSAYHWAHKTAEMLDTDTNINFRDEWVNTTAYAFRDSVQHLGSCFYCHTANTNNAPTPAGDNQYWGRMALRGGDGSASSLTIGTVTTGAAGSAAGAVITGSPPVQQLNLTIPSGKDGTNGTSPDMSNYYNKTEVQNLINSDLSNYYTKTDIQNNYYNKSYIDGLTIGGDVAPSAFDSVGAEVVAGVNQTNYNITISQIYPGSYFPIPGGIGPVGPTLSGSWRVQGSIPGAGYGDDGTAKIGYLIVRVA